MLRPARCAAGKMESMELPGAPDAAAMAAAMMQDMGPESALQRAMATSGPGTVVVQASGWQLGL